MSVASERFERAAVLGIAMAGEARRILREHMTPSEVADDGTILISVPFPDSELLRAVLDVAAECFGQAGASREEARRQALDTLLQLAGPDMESQLNSRVS
ncbi:hypothetical protein [Thermoactinospora rubra]|uniref:hypothetical protein n=1 Tax=Thermoactinospora rubra TaxID=1088767 RepID=UPI000A0F47A9|nr:hypothetical protein [Thermoactinospora rubra]